MYGIVRALTVGLFQLFSAFLEFKVQYIRLFELRIEIRENDMERERIREREFAVNFLEVIKIHQNL